MKNLKGISKTMMVAAIVSVGLTASSMILADEAKLDRPQDLAAQVIDNGTNQDGSAAKKEEVAQSDKQQDEAKPVPHFAGHAFAE